MFKTRSGSKFLDEYNIIIDRYDNQVTIGEHLRYMDRTYPGISKLYKRAYIDNISKDFIDVIKQPITSLVEGEYAGRFLISGNVIQIYHILKSFEITRLISELIYNYVSQEIIPESTYGLTIADGNDYNRYTKKHRCKKKDGDIYCPILCENIKPGNTVVTLPCGHQFSARPIRKWLTSNSSCCPNCRCDIRGEGYIEHLTFSISEHIYETYYNGLYTLFQKSLEANRQTGVHC